MPWLQPLPWEKVVFGHGNQENRGSDNAVQHGADSNPMQERSDALDVNRWLKYQELASKTMICWMNRGNLALNPALPNPKEDKQKRQLRNAYKFISIH
jgi:hypothetical protein